MKFLTVRMNSNFKIEFNTIHQISYFIHKLKLNTRQPLFMSFLKKLNQFLKPQSISCFQPDGQPIVFDQATPDQFQQISNPSQRIIPSFEQLLTPALMVTGNMDFIKGFRFDINLPLSQHFNTSYSWNIPNSGQTQSSGHPMMPPQPLNPLFTFSTQLVRDIKGRQPTTIMVGKVDSQGKVDSIFIKKLNEYLTFKLTGQFMPGNLDHGMVMLDLNYDDKDCNGEVKVGPGHWGINYMQRVHKNIMLGFDYTNVYQQKMSAFSYGAKGFIKNHTLMAQYMALHQQLNIAYMIPVKRGSTFISHYRYEATSQKSSAIIGWKQRYQTNEIVATIDSRLKLVTNFTIKGPSYGIRLCAQADYQKQEYNFGYGITIGMME